MQPNGTRALLDRIISAEAKFEFFFALPARVRRQKEMKALCEMEETKTAEDNNKSDGGKMSDMKRLESIEEEEQRRSGESTPNNHNNHVETDNNCLDIYSLSLRVCTDSAVGILPKCLHRKT